MAETWLSNILIDGKVISWLLMTDFSTVSTSTNPVGEKGKEWSCNKESYCPQLIVLIRNGWTGLGKKKHCHSGLSLHDKAAAWAECFWNDSELALALPWKCPIILHLIQAPELLSPDKMSWEGHIWYGHEWNGRNNRNPIPARPWDDLADLESSLSMKAWLIYLWKFGTVLPFTLSTPQMNQNLVSCLQASLLDRSHLLASSPPTSLILLSGESHVPSRKANYLPLTTFPCACTYALRAQQASTVGSGMLSRK